MITVSVIIPTWNRSKVIKKAINSALNQTFSSLEVIIADDGSTDNTFEIVNLFKDKRIKWVSGVHTGLPGVVRNRGIKESKGEWIAFLDSDDEWLPEKLEKQLALAEKTGSLAVCCNAYGVNSQGERKKYLDYKKDTITFSDLIKVNYVILSSAVIHRSLLRKCLGFPKGQKFRNAPDYVFWLKVLTQTNFVYLDEILVNYLDEPEKSVRRFTKSPFLQKKIILEDFLRWSWKNGIPLFYLVYTIKHYILILIYLFKNKLLVSKIFENKLQFSKLCRYYNNKFYNRPHINCNNRKLSDKNILDIVTVSFNNASVIFYQIELFKKNILDPYLYTVVDNSNDQKQQKKIFELCKKLKVGYIKAPINPYIFPSSAHGSTLNWIYKNYLMPRGARYWGFIDHDIFPIKPIKIIHYLKNQYIYGHKQERNSVWYLWAGFCFFNSNFVTNKKIDFMPNNNADTGAQNYHSIYKNINQGKIYFPEHKYYKLRKGNIPQSDMIEYIGDWVHIFNASGWKIIKDKNKKDQLVKNLLDKYLKGGN